MNETSSSKNTTSVERTSDRELVVTRSFDAAPGLVFDAWTKPALFRSWWVPKSFGLSLLSCDMDVRTGGTYRLVFQHPRAAKPMEFHGRYLEVVPNASLIWSNDEGGEGGAITTVTFTEAHGRTVVVMHDLHPTKEALDEAIASGSTSGTSEAFDQLDELLHAQR